MAGNAPHIPGCRDLALIGERVARSLFSAIADDGRGVTVTVYPPLSEGRTREGFDRAAATAQRLGAHPSVITIHRWGHADDGRPWIVTEPQPAESVDTLLTHEGPLDVERALQVGILLAGALETAHRAGIVHGDLSPARLVFGAQGQPLLAETGLAEFAVFPGLGALNNPVRYFAPPEVLERTEVTPATDVYSLATTVYALLAGRAPQQKPAEITDSNASLLLRILQMSVPPIDRPDLPLGLEDALQGPLSAGPGKRPQQVIEVAWLLQDVQRRAGFGITEPVVLDLDDLDGTRARAGVRPAGSAGPAPAHVAPFEQRPGDPSLHPAVPFGPPTAPPDAPPAPLGPPAALSEPVFPPLGPPAAPPEPPAAPRSPAAASPEPPEAFFASPGPPAAPPRPPAADFPGEPAEPPPPAEWSLSDVEPEPDPPPPTIFPFADHPSDAPPATDDRADRPANGKAGSPSPWPTPVGADQPMWTTAPDEGEPAATLWPSTWPSDQPPGETPAWAAGPSAPTPDTAPAAGDAWQPADTPWSDRPGGDGDSDRDSDSGPDAAVPWATGLPADEARPGSRASGTVPSDGTGHDGTGHDGTGDDGTGDDGRSKDGGPSDHAAAWGILGGDDNPTDTPARGTLAGDGTPTDDTPARGTLGGDGSPTHDTPAPGVLGGDGPSPSSMFGPVSRPPELDELPAWYTDPLPNRPGDASRGDSPGGSAPAGGTPGNGHDPVRPPLPGRRPPGGGMVPPSPPPAAAPPLPGAPAPGRGAGHAARQDGGDPLPGAGDDLRALFGEVVREPAPRGGAPSPNGSRSPAAPPVDPPAGMIDGPTASPAGPGNDDDPLGPLRPKPPIDMSRLDAPLGPTPYLPASPARSGSGDATRRPARGAGGAGHERNRQGDGGRDGARDGRSDGSRDGRDSRGGDPPARLPRRHEVQAWQPPSAARAASTDTGARRPAPPDDAAPSGLLAGAPAATRPLPRQVAPAPGRGSSDRVRAGAAAGPPALPVIILLVVVVVLALGVAWLVIAGDDAPDAASDRPADAASETTGVPSADPTAAAPTGLQLAEAAEGMQLTWAGQTEAQYVVTMLSPEAPPKAFPPAVGPSALIPAAELGSGTGRCFTVTAIGETGVPGPASAPVCTPGATPDAMQAG